VGPRQQMRSWVLEPLSGHFATVAVAGQSGPTRWRSLGAIGTTAPNSRSSCCRATISLRERSEPGRGGGSGGGLVQVLAQARIARGCAVIAMIA
jgi:hypothetical protein